MLNNTELSDETEQTSVEEKDKSRKLYRKPQLEKLGDLRTLTLGGTVPGSGDSGTSLIWDWPI